MKTVSAIVIVLGIAAAGTPLSQSASSGISETEKSAMVASCAACHGVAGEGNEARSAPRLAGLDAAYIERQLDLFASGKRGTAENDMFGPQMYVIAQSLTSADRKKAASHYSAAVAPSPHRTFASTISLQRGKQAYVSCAACHGDNGMGNKDIGAPRIAGQADWYVLASLRAYHARTRGYDDTDTNGQQMTMGLGSAETSDFESIAAYVASLGDE